MARIEQTVNPVGRFRLQYDKVCGEAHSVHCLHKAEGGIGPRRIITKHKEARADEFGISSWADFGLAQHPGCSHYHTPAKIFHLKACVVHKTKGKAEKDGGQSCKQGEKCDVKWPVRNG